MQARYVFLWISIAGRLLLWNDCLFAQSSTTQSWIEYMGNFPAGSKGNIEAAATYSTVLSSPKWRAFDLQCTPEIALNPHVDLMVALLMSNTFQNAAVSTLEIRPMAGMRLHLTPDKRVQARLLGRFEQRNLYDKTNLTWDHSTRTRFRAELIYPWNRKSMRADAGAIYSLLDAEAFINFSKDVKERFANRFRFRTGIGYMINTGLRLEFVYTLQTSVNAIEDETNTRENIFRLRVKQYFNRKK